jgi:hypothetical protein
LLTLKPPEGQSDLSAVDLAAVVKVLDRHRSEHWAMRRGYGIAVQVDGYESLGSIGWSDRSPKAAVVEIASAWSPYDSSYCEFPALTRLEIGAPGNDFSRMPSCAVVFRDAYGEADPYPDDYRW